MNIVCAPAGIVDIMHPKQGIRDMAGAGIKDILLDLALYYPGDDLEKGIVEEEFTKFSSRLKPLLSCCKEAELHISAVCMPYLNRDTKQKNGKDILLHLAEESLIVCKETGCRYLITRPLWNGVDPGKEWEENRKYYLFLAEKAKENQVMILLENQCRSKNGHMVRGVCSDAAEAAEWIDQLNQTAGEECFGFCMDVGVCSLCGQNMQEFSVVLGKRIKAVVLRDCDGHEETSMLPFSCVQNGKSKTDWLSLIRGLRNIGFDGQILLDLKDTAMAFSPLLRPQLMQLAKATAEYLKWQIEIEGLLKKYKTRVLFGAGNMCRNYMKCYGELYPPLFTCDNKESLWGTTIGGLEVRSPEVLKDLQEDCAVFICNIYYREIEEQLRRMGIRNPIEFFNDEYMPSFYFDRLERG